MRIKCPECQAVLTLGQPKPGRYGPKCKQCGKQFLIQVSNDDPPKIAVGKARPASAGAKKPKPQVEGSKSKAAGAPAAKANVAAETVAATVDPASQMDATMAAPSVGASSASPAVDATVDSSAATDVQATVDSPVVNPSNASAVDATIDSSAANDVQATVDTSAGGGNAAQVTRGGAAAKTIQGSTGAAQTAGGTDGTLDGSLESPGGKSVVRSGGKSVVRSGGKPIVSKGGSPRSQSAAAASAAKDDELPEKLGGYRVLRLLGRGAMGAVYEAKQVSLDRLVALKTIRGRLSQNPASLARFTREAYAAAQLTHHNVVQIYDFGEDDGKHFFSMEWVRGGPLDDLIREKGALDPRLAAGYVLQAARGLQFAHRNGMVHRDVKPANLLLSDEGVVKVADLGLVKIPDQMDPESDVGGASAMSGLESGTQVTMQGTAVGTPAYMAPEQGVDAAGVDHRADIYSLGCTLFYLLIGKPPFDGTVVSEVLEQHAHQPLPNLTQLNARVPSPLQQIVEKAMAKRPEDRYESLSLMIAELETFLGVSAEGKFSPTSTQADEWEALSGKYASATAMTRLSGPILLGFTAVCGLLTLVLPFAGLKWVLFGPALLVAAVATALVLGARGSAVVNSFRRWIGSLSWFDYAVGLIGLVVALLVVLMAGLWMGLVAGALLGAAVGAAYHFLLIAPSRNKSAECVQQAERFVRDLRIDGADEDGVRVFAARYGGKKWQGLFERLFSYDSLCKIREQLQGDPSFSGGGRTTLRDRVVATLSAKADANNQVRDHKRLAKIEERGLASEGVGAGEARERAWQMAAAVIDNAKVESVASVDAKVAAQQKRDRMKAMLADARSGKYAKKRDPLAIVRFALGGQTRLLAGCALLAIFAVWGQSNGLFDSIASGKVDTELVTTTEEGTNLLGGGTSGWSIGIAGILLVMSAFVSGWRMTPFAVVATVIILFGPSLGIPSLGPLKAWMIAAMAGIAVYVPGVMFGEAKEF